MSESTSQPSPGYLASFQAIRETANRVLNSAAHQHEWNPVDVFSVRNSKPAHPRMAQDTPSTIVLLVCESCRYPQTIELDGVWTIEQVRGQSTQMLLASC